jgi:ribosomal protein S18 acetylase RimI-like enzyme
VRAILVRPTHEDELAAVGALTLDAYAVDGFVTPDSPYAVELRDAATRAREAELYAAVDEDGALLGTVTYCPGGSSYQEVARAREGEFRMLAVSPHARRCGVAQALVRTCLRRSTELGYTAVALSSMPDQRAAHRLYERLGFRRAPELDWRPRPEIPLLGFRLDLTPPAG